LRGLEADLDVSTSVMIRIRSASPGFEAVPMPGRAPRAAWALTLAAGVGALVLLGTAAVAMVLAGDAGTRELFGGLASLGRGLLLIGEATLALAGRILGAGLIALAHFLAAARDAAPYVRGAGTVAATLGAVSILVSLHAFASARNLTPPAGFDGGTR
jgi:hypothetical protein